MRALRIVGGVVVGFACAAAIAGIAFGALQANWHEYAAAVPDRAYTLPMLWSRLGIGALLTLVSSAACTFVAGDRRAALVFGGLFVLVSLPSHLHYAWAEYPMWYHAVYLLYLIPIAWLGGRLVPSTNSLSSSAHAG